VLLADIAKKILAALNNNSAKSALVKVGALLVFSKSEVWRVTVFDAFSYFVGVFSLCFFIAVKGFFVYIDFPTDTAAMLTLIGYAGKILII
jgi:hypothetical protein